MERNTADGVDVFLDLLKRGIPAFSPHLSGAFPSAWAALTHGEWIAYDCAVIDRCTHMLMMPRWDTSKGAIAERDYWLSMSRRGLVHSVQELEAALTDDAVDPSAAKPGKPTPRANTSSSSERC